VKKEKKKTQLEKTGDWGMAEKDRISKNGSGWKRRDRALRERKKPGAGGTLGQRQICKQLAARGSTKLVKKLKIGRKSKTASRETMGRSGHESRGRIEDGRQTKRREE